MTASTHHKTHTVTIVLDHEKLHGVPQHTTPDEILRLGGIDPASHYLERIEGRHQESFRNQGDRLITVHDQERFVSLSTGPTPTS